MHWRGAWRDGDVRVGGKAEYYPGRTDRVGAGEVSWAEVLETPGKTRSLGGHQMVGLTAEDNTQKITRLCGMNWLRVYSRNATLVDESHFSNSVNLTKFFPERSPRNYSEKHLPKHQ